MRPRRILLGAVLLAAVYFAVFGGEHSVFDLRRIDRQITQETARLEEVRREVDGLRARADSLEHDPVALERLARERYGLIRPGERLYRFVDAAAPPDTAPPEGAAEAR